MTDGTRRAPGETGETPRLPVTWRPMMGRVVAYGMAAGVMITTVVLAIMIAPTFAIADRIGIVLVGVVISAALHLLGRCRVTADERGLTVVNVARVHTFEWAQVLRVSMEVGASWPALDLADGSSLGAMGIQSADGDRAKRAVAELQALLHAHGEAPEPRSR